MKQTFLLPLVIASASAFQPRPFQTSTPISFTYFSHRCRQCKSLFAERKRYDTTTLEKDERPMMYVEGGPITAAALSERCGEWMVGGDAGMENLGKETITHPSLEEAAAEASNAVGGADGIGKDVLDFALELSRTLDSALLPASEADIDGRIVLFADRQSSGLPSKTACLEALGLKDVVGGCNLLAVSTLDAMDWSESTGFCYLEDEDLEWIAEHEADDYQKILATTRLLGNELTDHFEFNMTDDVVCAPVLYGGRKGTAIVAVLSMRVWT